MKGKNNRKKIKTLYILGAGASYGATGTSVKNSQAPLDKDFCKRIKELDYQKPQWASNSRDLLLKQWKDFKPFDTIGLEAAVLKQLGHLEFLESIHKRRMKGVLSQSEYLNHLAHLICFILRKVKPSRLDPYRELFNKKFGQYDIKKVNNRIITFNYDDILDRHFVEKFGPQKTYFDKIKTRKDAGYRRREAKFESPLVLKLHGSINWLCQTEEFERLISEVESKADPYEIKSIWFSKSKIPSPEDSESPVVIPPLPVKPITSISLFEWLWTKAYEYLHEAEEIVVCGYSLPNTDRMATSLFSNFENQNLRKITVVDKDPTVLNKWRGLLRRNGISNARWSYCETFEEYTTDQL